ncbi:MAG: spore cortex biosynthesis protein YabQ [Oscillospiraceae bacterium]|nr:spore cortex biosynthesis protein YabQ [Oscillospiraceae bacterium]
MSVGIEPAGQVIGAAEALALGLALGIVYDALRGIRRCVRSVAAANLLDALFWLTALCATAVTGLWAGGGEVRLYTTLFAAAGAAAYFALLSPYLLPLFEKVAGLCLAPLKKCAKKLKKLFSFLKNRYKIKSSIIRATMVAERGKHEIQKSGYHYLDNHSGSLRLRRCDDDSPEIEDRRGAEYTRRTCRRGRKHDRKERRDALRARAQRR